MKEQSFDIQTHETENNFPYRLFFNRDISSQKHCHTEVEIIFAIQNSLKMSINGEEYILSEGDIAIASSGDIHEIFPSEHNRMIIQFKLELLKNLYANPEDIEQLMDKMHLIERVSHKWDKNTKRDIRNILLALESCEYINNPTGYRIKIYALIYRLADLFFNNIPLSNGSGYTRKEFKIIWKLEKVFLFLNQNFDRDIDISDAAAIMHYTPNYFNRLWKEYIGIPFHTYLNRYRIKQAASLLEQTDLNVSDICYKTGFQSIKTFNRVFKSEMKTSPAGYRKIYK